MANINPTEGSSSYNGGGAVYLIPVANSKTAGGVITAEPESEPIRNDALNLSDKALKLYYASATKPKQAYNNSIKSAVRDALADQAVVSQSTEEKLYE